MPDRPEAGLPRAISASIDDLPPAVAAALEGPAPPRRLTARAAGIDWTALEWGTPGDRPVLLIHGVTSSAATWWRVAPAVAAARFHVVAVDQAGHGGSRPWVGHHALVDNAADVAAFARATGVATGDLAVVGHSWGAMTAAELPRAGLAPATLVLLDPPAVPAEVIATILDEPTEQRYDDLEEAIRVVRRENPGWSDGDVRAKAAALTEFDEGAVRDVLLGNAWDGGLAALAHPAASGIETWVLRGEAEFGGYLGDEAAAALGALIGRDHVITIAGGPHSPQRTHAEATVVGLLRALASGTAAHAAAQGAREGQDRIPPD